MRIFKILILFVFTFNVYLAQESRTTEMSEVQTVGEGVVWRIADSKNKGSNASPSWEEIKITNIFGFQTEPVIGNKVTVIPINADIPAFDLKVEKTEIEDTCGQPPDWWSVELEPLTQKNHQTIFEAVSIPNRAAEYPFDVVVIYPNVSFAKQVKKNQITKKLLPKGTAIKTVTAAIDLTKDGKPDILIVKYCCNNPNKPESECDLTCGKTYKRVGNVWKIIDTSSPC